MNYDVLLSVKKISFKIKNRELFRDVTFDAETGKIYAIEGPNGCGKTTLLNLLSGLYKPTKGEIYHYGHIIKQITPYKVAKFKDGLARTFQYPFVVENLSVLENILLAHRIPYGEKIHSIFFGRSKTKAKEKKIIEHVERFLAEFDLYQDKNKLSKELSIGNKRLLNILVAISTDSKILLLDEPFSNLHAEKIGKLRAKLKETVIKENRTNLMVAHNKEYFENFVDIIFKLEDSKLKIVNTNH